MGILLAIALIVASGRVVIRARTYKSNGFTIDDGFFLLAVITFFPGIMMTYVGVPRFYLEQNVLAGLESAPQNYVRFLIVGEKLQDAITSLIGASIMSVKFSFLFFFRALLRQQKKMMVWWWCMFAIFVPMAFVMIFAFFIVCAHWNQEVFGQSSLESHRGPQASLTDALKVKCDTPAARLRLNGVLKAMTILDIFTDAFSKL